MYIEVLHDNEGKIIACYCIDTLPIEAGRKFFEIEGEMPAGATHCRINIDTMAAMQIDSVSESQGLERSAYIKENFIINIADNIPVPDNVVLPQGMNIKGMTRKQ